GLLKLTCVILAMFITFCLYVNSSCSLIQFNCSNGSSEYSCALYNDSFTPLSSSLIVTLFLNKFFLLLFIYAIYSMYFYILIISKSTSTFATIANSFQ